MSTARLIEDSVEWGATGLVAAIIQDRIDGRVLMLGWMDAEALAATMSTGDVHFHSRSRNRLWRKGETSGNALRVADLAIDCDGDALLIRVDPYGPACHRGTRSCFDEDGAEPWSIEQRPEEAPANGRSARVDVAPGSAAWPDPPASFGIPDGPADRVGDPPAAPDTVARMAERQAGSAAFSAPFPAASASAPAPDPAVASTPQLAPEPEPAPVADDPPATAVPPPAAAALEPAPTATSQPPPTRFEWLETLWETIESRVDADPAVSYTARLLRGGVDAPARKVVEEATEVLIAAKDDAVATPAARDRTQDALAGEVADLLYHTLVLLKERGLEPADVIDRLRQRHRA